jgi:DNA-binding beta-propeller fold protein YncE
MFMDNQLNIYVSDSGNSRVVKWLSTNTTSGILVAGGNGAGNAATQFNGPYGIYVDSTQGIYIVDSNNHRVQYWTFGK